MEWMSQLFRPHINRGMQRSIPPREHTLLSSSQVYVTVCTWFTDNKSINIVTFTHTNYLLIKELGVDAVDGVSYSGTQHSPPPPTHTLSSSQVYITVCMTTKFPWTRTFETSLFELVRQKTFVWEWLDGGKRKYHVLIAVEGVKWMTVK